MAEKSDTNREKVTDPGHSLPAKGRSFNELWEMLSENQRRYVLARPKHTTKADTARAIGLTPKTIYTWPDEVEKCAGLITTHRAQAVRTTLEEGATQAALRLLELMESTHDATALGAVKFLVEQAIGKAVATQKTELSGKVEVEESEVSQLRADLLARLDKDEEQ